MKHLSENELIDILFQEELPVGVQKHLDTCVVCKTQLNELEEGLTIARQTNPGEFILQETPVPRSVNPWKKIGIAVAAVFLMMSFLGFKAEVNDGNFSVQFSLFSNPSKSNSAADQLVELESRLIQQMNLQAEITSSQINQQFSDLQDLQYRELLELSVQVKDNLDISGIQTDRRIAMLNRDLEVLKTQSAQRNHP